jgi:hypothetical protein
MCMLQDYMDDVHGKEVPLHCVTVKLPGHKPRGSKTVMGAPSTTASSVSDSIGGLSLAGQLSQT